MTSTIVLPEEIRELLGEIARDPRSRLFRQTPHERVAAPLIGRESVSARTAGWKPAERHLIQAYRDELACALGAVFHHLSVTRPIAREVVGAGRGCGREAIDRARRLEGSEYLSELDPDVRAAVEQITSGTDCRLDLITNLIVRLRNDHRSANLHGYALLIEGDHAEARAVLGTVLDQSIRSEMRFLAAINCGLAAQLDGAPLAEQLEFYMAALSERPEPEALASVLVTSALLGRSDLADLAGRFLNEQLRPTEARTMELVGIYRRRRWTDSELEGVRAVRDRIDGVTGRILDAVIE